MFKFALATSASFVTIFFAGTILALWIVGPFLSESLGVVRSKSQGLVLPAILGGYLVLAAALVFLYPRVDLPGPWAIKGILLGWILGILVFAVGHSIIAGWSTIDARALILSGLIDSLAPALGGLVVAAFYR